ncbi:unnamed protein product [Ambrosiozyma monospora]|uniref:Unnamed protein product n=1 Tax=Ambrosiozyma monospora TaxID=43982 RepID=A0A9W7DGB7_AMBMO|nr:unnamed protein product [Ambrosiozyma monospora]
MSIPSLEQARDSVAKKNYKEAQQIYDEILALDPKTTNLHHEKVVELQESAILDLGELYKSEKDSESLVALISKARNIMGSFAKSKTAKVIKSLIDLLEQIDAENTVDLTIKVTQECIDWAIEEKRTFLRQSLQSRLAGLYYKKHNYQDSLAILEKLLKELKKLDDKSSLVEVQLLEAKNFFQLKNFPKSRAAITSSRTSANAIYCPSQLQAELDLMSGILHAEDKDFKTAYSYFYESFENYQLHPEKVEFKAIKVLKYMLLCKIMTSNVDEVAQIVKSKNCAKYQDKLIEGLL